MMTAVKSPASTGAQRLIARIDSMNRADIAQMRANALTVLAGQNVRQRTDAQAVLDALDELEIRRTNGPLQGVVVAAFRDKAPTKSESRLIRVLLDHPDSTSDELAAHLGQKKAAWVAQFGAICERRRANLPVPPAAPERFATGDAGPEFWCGILAAYDHSRGTFRMREEAELAFADLGISNPDDLN
jgi:hypothetical protein